MLKRREKPVASPPAKRRDVRAQTPRKLPAADRSAEEDVLTYVSRFRNTEASIMTDLRLVACGRGASPQCCALLRDFIRAYGVVRCFAGMNERNVAILAPLVRHLQARWPRLQQRLEPSVVVSEVEALADACKAAGFNRNVSFASKALNMLGLPVPIYSSECSAFLGLRGPSYGALHEAWTAEYAGRRRAYEAAAARLIGRGGLESQLGAEWFAVRGFDVHLLEVGGPMRA